MKRPKESKAEKLEREKTQREARIQEALRWPEYFCPPHQTSEQMSAALEAIDGIGVVRAWTYNSYNQTVSHGCYSSVSHGNSGDKTNAQNSGGPWYDTEEQALRAMRWEVCRDMAVKLDNIDAAISRASGEKP